MHFLFKKKSYLENMETKSKHHFFFGKVAVQNNKNITNCNPCAKFCVKFLPCVLYALLVNKYK